MNGIKSGGGFSLSMNNFAPGRYKVLDRIRCRRTPRRFFGTTRRVSGPGRERERLTNAIDRVAGNEPVERLTLWVQVLTGRELDAGGSARDLESATWHERRRRLQELGGPPLP